jgi:amino acid transporter
MLIRKCIWEGYFMTIRADSRAFEGEQENVELPSEQYVVRAMPAVLKKFDIFATYVMALFLITNAVSSAAGGPVSLTYLILGALIFFLPCVVASVQLGVMMPHEGALYHWTTKALNPFWGFFIAVSYWLTGVLAVITAASAFIQTVQGLNSSWLAEPWQQGVAILLLLVVVTLFGLQRMRHTQNFVNITFFTTLLATLLIGLAAIVWLVSGHAFQTDFSHPADWAVGKDNFFLFAIITLNFIGASGPLNMAGEIQGSGKDSRQVGRIIKSQLLLGTPVVFVLYMIVALSVLIVRGASALQASPSLAFEAFVTVSKVFGTTMGEIAIVCFLLYCIMAMVFYTYSSARLLFVAGVDGQIPSRFGRLNRNRVPGFATIFQVLATALVVVFIYVIMPPVMVAFFGGTASAMSVEIYTVTAAACTLVWTIATFFFFINLIAIYRKDRARFVAMRQFPLWVIWVSVVVGGIACILTIIGILLYPWIPLISANAWGYLVGGISLALLVISGVVSMFANMEATWENFAK